MSAFVHQIVGSRIAQADDNDLPIAKCRPTTEEEIALSEENQKLKKEIKDQKKSLALAKTLMKQLRIQLTQQEKKRQVLRKKIIGKENNIRQLRGENRQMFNDQSTELAGNVLFNTAKTALLKKRERTIQDQKQKIEQLEQEARNHVETLQRHKREMEKHKYKMYLISENIRKIQQLLSKRGPRYNQYAATKREM